MVKLYQMYGAEEMYLQKVYLLQQCKYENV